MSILLEQLFFGRGPHGYAVLGATSDGESFRSDVESLCEAIGTPSSARFQPFLVSRPCRGSVLMARVCRGEPDSVGRDTIFFHILVGADRDLASAHLDAFVLDERGLFQDKLPRRIDPLEISVGERAVEVPSARFKVGFPAVIMSKGPENDLIRSMLGTDVLKRAWSTFAFHRMAGFDLCALDADVSYPSDVACYDVNGKLLSKPTVSRTAPSPSAPTARKGREGGSAMLKISIVANVILILLCAVAFLCNPTTEPKEDSSCTQRIQELGSEKDRLALENSRLQADVKRLRDELAEKGQAPAMGTSRDELLRQLKSEFEGKYRGKRQSESILRQIGSKYQDAFRPYMRFVNEVILESSNK